MEKENMIGKLIKESRARLGYTQQQLADKSGLSKGTVVNYETGKRTPTMEILAKIARALGVNASYLMGDTGITTINSSHIVNITGVMYPLSAFQQNAFRGGASPMADGSTPVVHVHKGVLITYDPDNPPYVVELTEPTQMERNARIFKGDSVVVNPAIGPGSGMLAFVVYSGVPMVRRLFISTEGGWSMQSDLPPVDVSAEDIARGSAVYKGRVMLRYAVAE